MALELVHDEVLTLPQLVHKVCHAPAILFDVADRGYLREGYFADLALVDMLHPHRVEREDVLYKCGWSPLEGDVLRSRVHTTIVNGSVVYQGGKFPRDPNGLRLSFDRV